MTTAPAGPFVLLGDPTVATCEGDVCALPEAVARVSAPQDQEPAVPRVEAPAPQPPG